jgi:hypothetical protein
VILPCKSASLLLFRINPTTHGCMSLFSPFFDLTPPLYSPFSPLPSPLAATDEAFATLNVGSYTPGNVGRLDIDSFAFSSSWVPCSFVVYCLCFRPRPRTRDRRRSHRVSVRLGIVLSNGSHRNCRDGSLSFSFPLSLPLLSTPPSPSLIPRPTPSAQQHEHLDSAPPPSSCLLALARRR